MKKRAPWDPDANEGAGGPGDESLQWVNHNALAGVEGSVIDALIFRDVQEEMENLIIAGGLEPDIDDKTQITQAIINLTRVQQTPGLETGYFDMYVPTEYATIQAALDYLSALAIPNDVIVRINVAAGDYTVAAPIYVQHPQMDRIQIIGAEISGFPASASMNQTTASAAETAVRSVWSTRIVVQATAYAGMYLRGGTLGLLKNIAFIGTNTTGQHGLLVGDWEHGLGAGGCRIEKCWAHRCGEDGFRANYNSQVISTNVGASWCGKQGFRIANASIWTAQDYFFSNRNTQAGALCVDTSSLEFLGVAGGCVVENNGLNGLVAFGTAQISINQGCISRGNAGAGWYAANNGYIETNGNSLFTGGSNTVADIMATFNARIHFNNAAGLGLTSSPSLATLGNSNSYIVG